MDNYFKFTGDVVNFKDFGDNGGNVKVKGIVKELYSDSPVELSIFMYGDTWNNFINQHSKYDEYVFEGQFRIRVHYTKSKNKKEYLKLVADKYTRLNKPNCKRFA